MTLWSGGVRIENAFAHSKNRWRVLTNMNLSILYFKVGYSCLMCATEKL